MNRRSRDSVFMTREVLSKADERRKLGLWEFMQIFFPEKTNRKQFDCALKFMKRLLESKAVESSSLKEVAGPDYHSLLSIVLPKLQKFGLVKIVGERGKGKTYAIQLEKTFSDRIRHLGLEWFRIYAKYGDDHGR